MAGASWGEGIRNSNAWPLQTSRSKPSSKCYLSSDKIIMWSTNYQRNERTGSHSSKYVFKCLCSECWWPLNSFRGCSGNQFMPLKKRHLPLSSKDTARRLQQWKKGPYLDTMSIGILALDFPVSRIIRKKVCWQATKFWYEIQKVNLKVWPACYICVPQISSWHGICMPIYSWLQHSQFQNPTSKIHKHLCRLLTTAQSITAKD